MPDPLIVSSMLLQAYEKSEHYQGDLDYWRQALADLDELSARAGMNTASKNNKDAQSSITTTVHLSPAETDRLKVAATELGVTWVETMIVLYGAFVHRLCSPRSRSEQFLAVPVMARSHTAQLRTPTMAVNVLPLRLQVDNDQSVREFLGEAIGSLKGLLLHQRLRGETLPQVTGDTRVADVLHGVGVNAKAFSTRVDFAGVPGNLRNVAGGPPEDLGLVLTPAADGGLDMAFETDPERVSADQAQARLESLREFLTVLEDPQRRIGQQSVVPERQVEVLLDERAGSEVEGTESAVRDALGAAIAGLGEAGGGRLFVHSDSAVAEFDGRELWEGIQAVGRFYRHEVLGGAAWKQAREEMARGGLQPVIALELDRGRELVMAVLAAFAVGAPFVYIDPNNPVQRNHQILHDAQPVAHLRWEDLRRCWDRPLAPIDSFETSQVEPEELAYLIYTSGSTGQPKGVEVPRRAINALFAQHQQNLYSRAGTAMAHTASFSFDASFDQLFWLLAGHDVHLYPQDATGDAEQFLNRLATDGVTALDTTPSMMKALLAAGLEEAVPALRLVVLGGEELPADLWTHLAATNLEVINAYGPTEATVDALLAEVTPGLSHVGRPVPGIRAYLVDNGLHLVGNGEVGELVLAGPQLALGYRGLPDATAQAFVDEVCIDPRRGPERIYRTGDRARWIPGRGYEFLGRADGQLEINGQRVELVEVESVVSRLPEVRACAVASVTRGDDGTAAMLIAAVVPEPGYAPDPAKLRTQLHLALPAAVIPRRIHIVDALPTTTSGKIDRAAIVARDAQGHASDADQTSDQLLPTPAQRTLYRIVCEILQLSPDQADPNLDFISLGGESIAALHVAVQARQQGLQLQPKELLSGVSLTRISLSQVAPSEASNEHSDSGEVSGGDGSASGLKNGSVLDWGEVPWSPVARLQVAAAPNERALRRHVMYRWLPAGSEREEVLRAIDGLQRRHGSLRMLIDWVNNAQLIPRTPLMDCEDILQSDTQSQGLLKQLVGGIAPDRGVMWQVGLCDGRALVVVHHLAIDALSWDILEREWNALISDANLQLPPLHGSLRGHWLGQAGLRTGKLAAGLRPRRAATIVWKALALGEAVAVDPALARRFRAGREEVIIGLVAKALHAAGLGEFRLVVEGHGRDTSGGATDISQVIGWFTTERVWDFGPTEVGAWSSVAEWVRAARLAATQARDWDAEGEDPRRRVVVNVLGAQAGESFGVLESEERHLTEALTINLFLGTDASRPEVDVEYVADLELLREISGVGADVMDQLHEHLCAAARSLIVADRLCARRALPSDFQPVQISDEHLRELEDKHGPLGDIVPATLAQQGLLFHAATRANEDRYVTAATVDLLGVDSPAEAERVHKAMQAVLDRHAGLRGLFDCSAQPLMVIPERTRLPWAVHDCRADSRAIASALVEELQQHRAQRRVDLENGPLITADLVLLPGDEGEAALVLGSHHVLTDGWSTSVMLADLHKLLAGEELGPAPSFAEFARALGQRQPEQRERERHAWKDILPGEAEGSTELGGGVVAGLRELASNKNNDDEYVRTLYQDTDGSLLDVATALGTTPSVLVQTAWLLTLSALHGGRAVTTGVTLSGRPVDQPRMAQAVGMFITTLPLHLRIQPEWTLAQTVREVARRMVLISENQQTPLADIERWAGHKPLFDTAVVYDHHAHFGVPRTSSGDGPRIDGMRAIGRTHYPVTVVCPPGENLKIQLAHRPELIDVHIVDAAARWFETFLSALKANNAVGLAELLPNVGEYVARAGAEMREFDTGGESEGTLADIQRAMEKLLGHGIGPEENFFDCGGDSLLAMRLMGALRKQGIRLKIQDIVDTGTPRAMAARVGAAPKRDERSARRTIWCAHPIGGHGLAFAPLARLVSADIRTLELPSPLPQVSTLAELAQLYIRDILTAQPTGPFYLLGYSFGGILAEVIAAELQKQGHVVEFLGILDTYPSGTLPTQTGEGLSVQDIAKADGISDLLEGTDVEANIRFCLGLLETARASRYTGEVDLVVATQHNQNYPAAEMEWDPAGQWRRQPGVGVVRVSHLDMTHAQLVQDDGWKEIADQWGSRMVGVVEKENKG